MGIKEDRAKGKTQGSFCLKRGQGFEASGDLRVVEREGKGKPKWNRERRKTRAGGRG